MSPRVRQITMVVAVTLAAIAICAPGAAVAKKKRPRVLDLSNAANATIPGRAGSNGPDGVISSMIQAPKRFRGLVIRDVNVTLQTTGVSGAFPAASVRPQLTAPNGATVRLFTGLQSTTGAHNIGPLTIDDESPFELVSLTSADPVGLYDPWIGAARPEGGRRLAVMDNGPANGTWTLTVVSALENEVSLLNSWSIHVIVGRPYRT
jgi:hypothetical protein